MSQSNILQQKSYMDLDSKSKLNTTFEAIEEVEDT